MQNKDYENKRRECWEEYKEENLDGEVQWQPVSRYDVFCAAFDRAYALGKEKEAITQGEIEKAAKEYATEVDKNVCDLYGIENPPTSLTFGECAAESFREGVKFALGKQEKNAGGTPISERLYEEEKGQLEGIYYYLKRAADKQEDDSVSVAILFEVMERLEDMFGIDLLTNRHVKPTPKDADTVIQGWVCRDKYWQKDIFPSDLFLAMEKPQRNEEWKAWTDMGANIPLNTELFPDLTWSDEPQECEIIIKRKKK